MQARIPFRIIQLILLLALVRHLWLALYIHPYADDYSYAVAGMTTPLAERLVQEYDSWNGRYASNVLVLRGPLVLGIEQGLPLYRLAAMAMFLVTVLAAYAFLRTLLPALQRTKALMCALAFVLLYVNLMPDASEGFYWYTGAVTYQLANVLCLFLAARWLRALRDPLVMSVRWTAIQGLLIAFIVGCNEVHMSLIVLSHTALLLWYKSRTGRIPRRVLLLFVMAVMCGIVVAVAPGNYTRGALFPLRHDVLRTLGYSVAQTGRFAAQWVLWLVLPSLAFITLLRQGGIASAVKPFTAPINKWWVLALPFMTLFVCMVVTYWPTGLLGQYRTVNMALFFFLPSWFVALAVWDQQVLRVRGWSIPHAADPRVQWALVFLVCGFLWVGRDGRVTDDLLSGRMARYDAGLSGRIREATLNARASSGRVLAFDPVELPTSLTILALDTAATNWMNRSYADYFGVAGVRITATHPRHQAE